MNRSSSRINKKKAIPLYFQKSHSNSQFLATANYKHQIKTLKKTNKELACSLQDAKIRVADHEKALAECSRENTQTRFVKIKIKDIVETVKKLVTDLGVVYDELDGKSFDLLGNLSASHQETRLKIRHPSLSTIEESASMSTIESDLTKEDSLSVESFTRPTTTALSIFDADSSQTEIYNVPLVLASEQKLLNVSNGSAVARSSKSLERTGSFPLDPDSPPTPQLKPITSTTTAKIAAKSTISKIPLKKPVASIKDNSPMLEVSSSHVDRRKTFVVDGKVEESQMSFPVSDQRGTVVLNSLANKDKSDTFSNRRGTFVLSSLPDNPKSDIISDRRGTFVLSSLPDTAKSDVISDRRGTLVLNSLTDDAKPDAILNRRATYFIPTQSNEQPDTSPPKEIEGQNPVQNAAPNQTILLCEDMELTEILPPQNQAHQFIPINPWNEKLETEEPGLNENLFACVRGQPSCTTSLVKQFPVPNINSSNQLEVSITHGAVNDAEIKNRVSVKKDSDNKSLASNILPKTNLLAETSAPNQDVNLADPQPKKDTETKVEKKIRKKDDTNVKCSAPKPPSPIAYYAKHDMSIQHKIFESFSTINTVPDMNKKASDSVLVAKRVGKESTASKNSFSPNQPEIEKGAVKEDVESPKTGRRSNRTQNKCFANFFSDSDESGINFDEDFVPEKRFSLKPGRKIINPNNNKVFVFKKNSKKQGVVKDTPSSLDMSVDEDIKNDQEKDIFNFSASSEADKSPLTKDKKRKSVVPKNNKRSVKKQSDVRKRLSKTTSKRSSKPEINKDDVSVAALPRKSILCLNRGNSPLPLRLSSRFSRKSVRFTLAGTSPQDEINDPKQDSPIDENITPVNQESDYIHDSEKVSAHNTRSSQSKRSSGNKKYISARSNSLTATGDILKSSSAKSKKSRKRQSCNLYSDSLEDAPESGCSPKKKIFQVSNETPSQKIERHTNLNCEKQEQVMDVKNRFEPSQDISDVTSSEVPENEPVGRKKEKKSGHPNLDANVKVAGSVEGIEKTNVDGAKSPFSGVSERRSNKKQSIVDEFFLPEVHEKKPTDRKTGQNSGRILSELPQNLEANVNDTKRPFSLVSERRSNNKQSIADELFPSLNDAICEMVDGNMETAFKLVEDEPTEIYNIKEMANFGKTDCNKGISAITKTPKQKGGCGKKKSSKRKKTSSKQSKDKENTPYNAEKNFKLDVLTSDNDLCTLLEPKECLEKTVVKPKTSRKKKESTPLLQNDLKVDALASEDATGSDEAVGSRSRRNRKIMSFKEPSLNSKMRRE
ncbi:unnamed protein product [Larinioides sclopetarius]|uniref:Shugoshin C-terminal domain-containing protein n=1 Tax=Larinioides sclopetarius TaxID=280406 RepID=A0AAV2BH01_9ARAC